LKSRTIFISFLFIIFLTIDLASSGIAIKYGAGIEKDEEIIWNCKVSNTVEMERIFGVNWDNSGGPFENLRRGKNLKWKIKNVDVNETIIDIEIDEWLWNNDDDWGISDNNFKITYFSNLKEYEYIIENNFLNYSFFIPFLFPVPVSEFLGNIKLNKPYDVDNRVLTTINVDLSKDSILPNYPKKDISIIAMYNERGILMSYKLYLKGNIVIVDISLQSLPFYVIPTLVGLTMLIFISIIVYIIKRRKLKNNFMKSLDKKNESKNKNNKY